MTAIKSRLAWLFVSVDTASLGVFRIVFGVLMALSMLRFLEKGWVQSQYIDPTFYFAYPGFS